mmetsp:Transcript_11182/g.25418  ORF Transcript_11182/g.25418 Transcript_11182/m.25418 type:complete len:576 (+) Transcript_11182:33-1760(+)
MSATRRSLGPAQATSPSKRNEVAPAPMDLKGKAVSFDDLIGFSKLQELLKTLIGSLNDHDSQLNELRTKHPLGEVIETLKQDLATKVSVHATSMEEIRQEAEVSNKAFAELEAEVAVDHQTLDKVRIETASATTALAGLEVRCKAIPELASKMTKIAELEERLLRMEKKAADTATVEDVMTLETRVQHIESLVPGMTELPAGSTESAASHDSGMMSRALERIEALETKATETLDTVHGLSHENTALEEKFNADVSMLQKEISNLRRTWQESIWKGGKGGSERMGEELLALIEKLDALDMEVRGNLHESLAAMERKLSYCVKSLNAEISDIRQLVGLQSKHAAAATTHCLACFASRLQTGQISPREGDPLLGADGKPYLSYQRGGGFKVSSAPSLAQHRQAILASRGMLPKGAEPVNPQSLNLQGLQHTCYLPSTADHVVGKDPSARCPQTPQRNRSSSTGAHRQQRPATAGSRPSSAKKQRQLIVGDKAGAADITSLCVDSRPMAASGGSTAVPDLEWSQTPVHLSPMAGGMQVGEEELYMPEEQPDDTQREEFSTQLGQEAPAPGDDDDGLEDS